MEKNSAAVRDYVTAQLVDGANWATIIEENCRTRQPWHRKMDAHAEAIFLLWFNAPVVEWPTVLKLQTITA